MNRPVAEPLLTIAGLDLDRVCELLRLPRAGWPAAGPLRQLAEALAVQVLATALRDRQRLTWEAALLEACDRLGVKFDSHTRTLRKWRAAARRQPDPAAPGSGDRQAVPSLRRVS